MNIFRIAVAACLLACATPALAETESPPPTCQESVCPTSAPEPKLPVIARAKVDTAITAELSEAFVSFMTEARIAGADAVIVEINSPGGSVSAGFKMAKAIEESPLAVVCIVDGDAASMAFYLLQSCDLRVMTDRSVLMAHEPSAMVMFAGGQAKSWKRLGDNMSSALTVTAKAMNHHMARRMRVSYAEFCKRIADGREWWFDSMDAGKYGAVDLVVESVQVFTDALAKRMAE